MYGFKFQLLGNEKLVQFLINNGANISFAARDGTTALHHAASVGMLSSFGISLTQLKLTYLFEHVIPLGFAKIAEILIQSGADVNAMDEDGWSPLHWIAKNGDLFQFNCFKYLDSLSFLLRNRSYSCTNQKWSGY